MILRTCGMLLVAAGIAAAQQASAEEKIRQQAAEVSRLMRESERLLLELTRVDRLVETQKQVEDELKKLIPPDQQGGAAGGEEGAQRRAQLEQQQKEIGRKIEEMLAGEKEKATAAAMQLEELLKNLPREQVPQPQGGGSGDKKEEREKRLKDKDRQEDKKQHQPQSEQPQPRDPKDKRRSDKRPRKEDPASARATRIEAWIAKLPAEEQERINRNDFSRVPARYRQLIQEYTAQRAKRAAEKEEESDR